MKQCYHIVWNLEKYGKAVKTQGLKLQLKKTNTFIRTCSV